MNGSVIPGYHFPHLIFPKLCLSKLISRPSSSRTPMISLRSVPPNLPKSRAVPPISKGVTSSLLAYPPTMSNRTTGGSLTLTSGERPTSSTLSYVVQTNYELISRPPQIGDRDRTIATLYDMLDHQDASNVDKKGLPLTVNSTHPCMPNTLTLFAGPNGVRY
jgi:hypothetical protein